MATKKNVIEQDQAKRSLQDLLDVMVALRTPGSGCPWDIEQTFKSIAPYTIEEAYEVADAIERGDMGDLKNELGDLLFQAVYHAQMAAETGAFDFHDVIEAITAKMISRHPHVFGDLVVKNQDELRSLWGELKAKEKARRSKPNPGAPAASAGLLDDVPLALPALTRAMKLQKRTAKAGFDWPDAMPALAKVEEEIAELRHEITAVRDGGGAAERIFEEFGDLLFVLANVARHLHIDPEASLRSANAKFIRRFGRIEDWLAEGGRKPEDATLEEMDGLWNRAKAEEKQAG